MQIKKNNIYVLTLLSILAFTVFNISSQVWNSFWLTETNWMLSGTCSVITTWGMPMLFVIMGVAFLTSSESYSVKYVYLKLVPRAFAGCVIWWTIIAALYMNLNFPNELDGDTFFECLSIVLKTPHNMMFLQIVLLFWLLYPLLKKISQSNKLTLYACIIMFSISSVFPFLENFEYVRYLTLFTNQIGWNSFTAFGGYVFLGVWLSNQQFNLHKRIVIYCAGILSTVAMYACTVFWSSETIGFDDRFVSYDSPLVIFQVFAIFVLLKALLSHEKIKWKESFILCEISKSAYAMIPAYVISYYFTTTIIVYESMPVGLSIIIESLVCYLLTLCLGFIFNKAPILSYFS